MKKKKKKKKAAFLNLVLLELITSERGHARLDAAGAEPGDYESDETRPAAMYTCKWETRWSYQ